MTTNKITFQELLDEFSAVTGQTKVFSRQFIKDIFATIREGLKKDEYVTIKGLGIFKLQEVAERENVNPRTGKTTRIEAHKRVVFKPEKALREKVNAKFEKLTPKTLKKKPVAKPEKGTEVKEESPKEPKMKAPEEPVLLIKSETNDIPPRSDAKPEPEESFGNEKKQMPTFIIEEKKKKSAWRWILPLSLIILIFIVLYIVPTKYDTFDNWRTNKKAAVERTEADPEIKEEADQLFMEAPKPDKLDIKAESKKPELSETKTQQNESGITEDQSKEPKSEPESSPVESVFIHMIKPGNTLWGLSKYYYKRASLWPNIYRKNVERLSTPDLLIVGRELLIPELQGGSYQLTKLDSARIAQGYYLAYQAYKKYDAEHAEAYLRVAKQFSTIRK